MLMASLVDALSNGGHNAQVGCGRDAIPGINVFGACLPFV